MAENPADKVQRVLAIFKACNVDEWARTLKQEYFNKAIQHLEDIAVVSTRKQPLQQLAHFLVQREH